jgi:hypothetical protein
MSTFQPAKEKQIYNGKDEETNIHVDGTSQALTKLLVTLKIIYTIIDDTCFT